MNRTQRMLLGLLAVQVVLILLLRAPFSGSTSVGETAPLLPGLEEIAATRLQFEGQEDESLTLEKQGDAWTVQEVDGYPADATKIEDLLETLGGLQVRRPVVSSDRYHKAFEVSERENKGRVRVWSDGDDPAADLILGSSPNYRALNVRRADDDRVYEVRGLASYDVSAKPSFWVEKQLVDVPEAELVGIRVTNAAGTIELEKQDDAWVATAPASLAGRELDASKIDTLVRQARSVRIDNPVGAVDEAGQGLDAAAATVVVRWRPVAPTDAAETDEGEEAPAPDPTPAPVEELTIRVGAKVADQESQRYVVRSGFPFAATVWESSVQSLIERTAEDLLPQPENETDGA